MKQEKEHIAKELPTVLAAGSTIEGNFSFDEPVCVEGTVVGKISSDSTLLVSESAVVEAETSVSKLIVYGNLEGDVNASELVEICPGAELVGNVSTKRLIVHDGGFLKGRVTQGK